jgi:hypothetical protein
VLDFRSFGIGVENKPWAGEQPDQVKDYLCHLRRRYGEKFVLLYLSGNGEGPQSVVVPELIRLEKRDQFRLLDYRTGLTAWLQACVCDCKAESVQAFLRQFQQYLMNKFEPTTSDWRGGRDGRAE